MEVAYISPYYTADISQIHARFLDWMHELREMDSPPFKTKVHSYVVWEQDELVYSNPPHYLGDPKALFPSPKNRLEGFLNVSRIRRDLQRQKPDIIHAVSINTPILAILKSLNIEFDLVIGPSIGGWNPVRPNELWLDDVKNRLRFVSQYQIRKRYLNLVPSSLFLSFTRYHKKMITTYGIPEQDIVPIKPGMPRIFYPMDVGSSEDIEILFVGSLNNEHKGYEIFLRALSRLENEISARIVGSGDPRWDLIEKLGINERVTVQGFIPRDELPKVYNLSDITVVPATDETGGTNTKFESLACGTPVVATDEEGINEYDYSDSVVYFSPREPDQLADSIKQACSNLGKLQRTAEKHADNYYPDQTLNQLHEIYKNL